MTDPTPAPWSVDLAGTTYPLVPRLPALRVIERSTGCTLFALVAAAAEGGLTIEQMTCVTIALAAPAGDDPLFGPRDAFLGSSAAFLRLSQALPGEGCPAQTADPIAAAIIEASPMSVIARLVIPLTAAIAGAITADGAPKIAAA